MVETFDSAPAVKLGEQGKDGKLIAQAGQGHAEAENLATLDPSQTLLEGSEAGGVKAKAELKEVEASSGISLGDVALYGGIAVAGAVASRYGFGKQAYMAAERGVASLATKVTGLADVGAQSRAIAENAELFSSLSPGLNGVKNLAVGRFSFLNGGKQAFMHQDGTVVANSVDNLGFFGQFKGVEAVNKAGDSLKILKENGKEATSWTFAQARTPGLEGFSMELRTGSEAGLTLKRGSRVITGMQEGILVDTYAATGVAKELPSKLWTAAWNEANATSQTLRATIKKTPTIGA